MSGAKGEVTIDLDRVFLDACNDAVKASTWMPAEYTANDWQADVLDLLRNGPGTLTPQPAASVDVEALRTLAKDMQLYRSSELPLLIGKAGEWQSKIEALIDSAGEAKVCTCPSGDGSLRWPCPTHPPQPAEGVDDEVREWVRANLPESYANKPLIEILRLLNAAGVEAEQDLIDSAGGAKENDNGA